MRKILNKKGVSPVIGYILLISFVIVISLITFQWVKTYIPKEALQCPDGVSMFVQESTYDCSTPPGNNISLTLKNNGRFNLSGYFIRASQDPNQLATDDLSYFITSGDSGKVSFGNTGTTKNSFGPGESETESFTITTPDLLTNPLSYIEIIPIRFEEIDNKLRLSSCSDAKIREVLCPDVVSCTPAEGNPCSGFECGTVPNGDCTPVTCGDSGGTCEYRGVGFVCNDPNGGQCVNTCDGTWNEQDVNAGVDCDGGLSCTSCGCDSGYIPANPKDGSCVAVPELALELISTTPSGKQVTFVVNKHNLGTEDATNFYVNITPNGEVQNSDQVEYGPYNLTKGTFSETTITINYKFAGTYNPEIMIDNRLTVNEINETNNTVTTEVTTT